MSTKRFRSHTKGKTVVYRLVDDQPEGAIALADVIRPESPETVNHLKKMGLQVMMLTGDARTVAEWVGRELDLAYTHQGWSLYERPDLPLQQGTE